jgi:hypothetical protein
MTRYRIKEIGKSFVVGTDEQDILVCADLRVAQQISDDAEHGCNGDIAIRHEKIARMLKAKGKP